MDEVRVYAYIKAGKKCIRWYKEKKVMGISKTANSREEGRLAETPPNQCVGKLL